MIARFYAEHVNLDEVDGYPFLQQLLIHNEAQIIGSVQVEETPGGFIERYSKPHVIEKKKSARAASNASWYVEYGRR